MLHDHRRGGRYIDGSGRLYAVILPQQLHPCDILPRGGRVGDDNCAPVRRLIQRLDDQRPVDPGLCDGAHHIIRRPAQEGGLQARLCRHFYIILFFVRVKGPLPQRPGAHPVVEGAGPIPDALGEQHCGLEGGAGDIDHVGGYHAVQQDRQLLGVSQIGSRRVDVEGVILGLHRVISGPKQDIQPAFQIADGKGRPQIDAVAHPVLPKVQGVCVLRHDPQDFLQPANAILVRGVQELIVQGPVRSVPKPLEKILAGVCHRVHVLVLPQDRRVVV